MEMNAVAQVELHDLRERGEHSNVTWGDGRVGRAGRVGQGAGALKDWGSHCERAGMVAVRRQVRLCGTT